MLQLIHRSFVGCALLSILLVLSSNAALALDVLTFRASGSAVSADGRTTFSENTWRHLTVTPVAQADGFTRLEIRWNDFFRFGTSSTTCCFYLELRTPAGPLAVGSYSGALSNATAGQSGIEFVRDSLEGTVAMTGSFEVLEVELGPDDLPTSLAVDFVQFEQGDSQRWVSGSLRFDSDWPIEGVTGTIAVPAEGGQVTLSGGTSGTIREPIVTGDRAYARDDRGIFIVDLQTPNDPIQVGYAEVWPSTNGGFQYAAQDGLLFVTSNAPNSSGRLRIIDVTIPTTPVTRYDAIQLDPGLPRILGDLLFIDSSDDLLSFDVSNPDSPVLRDTLVLGGFRTGLVIDEPIAYSFDFFDENWDIIDFSNPDEMVIRGAIPGAFGGTFAADGDLVIAEDGFERFVSFDVSNLDAPVALGNTLPRSAVANYYDLALVGNLLLMSIDYESFATIDDSVDVMDASDPTDFDRVAGLVGEEGPTSLSDDRLVRLLGSTLDVYAVPEPDTASTHTFLLLVILAAIGATRARRRARA